MTDIIDFVEKFRIDVAQYRLERRHPGDINTLLYGILTGFQFANTFMTFSQEMNEALLKIISDDEENIHELLVAANKFLSDPRFSRGDFVNIEYRRSLSHADYCKGIQDGFRYAMAVVEFYVPGKSLVEGLVLARQQIANVAVQVVAIVNRN